MTIGFKISYKNYKVIIVSSIVTAVLTSVFLKLVGPSIGIPTSWNAGIAGGLSGVVPLYLGQVYTWDKEEE